MSKTSERRAFLRGIGSLLDLGATQRRTTHRSNRRIPGFEDDARALAADGRNAGKWAETIMADEKLDLTPGSGSKK